MFCVHHPGAGLKKITLDGTTVNGNGYYWEFQYNDGRVIPGSSGSPLFDNNKRQVGIASFIYTNYCILHPIATVLSNIHMDMVDLILQ